MIGWILVPSTSPPSPLKISCIHASMMNLSANEASHKKVISVVPSSFLISPVGRFLGIPYSENAVVVICLPGSEHDSTLIPSNLNPSLGHITPTSNLFALAPLSKLYFSLSILVPSFLKNAIKIVSYYLHTQCLYLLYRSLRQVTLIPHPNTSNLPSSLYRQCVMSSTSLCMVYHTSIYLQT